MTEIRLRKAELRDVQSNDFADSSASENFTPDDPMDHYGWFEVEIGPEGDEGADLFQVVVATPAAVKRVPSKGKFKGLVVPEYTPEAAVQAINSAVAGINGYSWPDMVRELRKSMHWEYEEMGSEPQAIADNAGELTIDSAARVVSLVSEGEAAITMRVPVLFGDITSAERRGKYILVVTKVGRVSFHVDTPLRVSNSTWREKHPLAGKMHWHSIRKALRSHCLLPQLKSRVDFHVMHSRYSSGGRSDSGGGGRVTVDKQKVLQCSATTSDHACRPAELGSALAEYLYLQPEDALVSDNILVAAVALLDRRLPMAVFQAVERNRSQHPMWTAFYDLRASLASEPGCPNWL